MSRVSTSSLDRGDQRVGGELARGDVDRQGQLPARIGGGDRGEVGGGVAEQPHQQVGPGARLLGDRHEELRRDRPALGMVPAGEGLDGGDPARGDVDDRLVMEGDVVGVEGGRQLAADLGAVADPLAQLGVEDLEAADAGAVPLERRLGVGDQRLGAHGGVVGDHDADRDRRGQLLEAEGEGIVEGAHDRSRELDDLGAVRQPAAHHDELVAAGPGDDIGGADGGEEPAAGAVEELIAGHVPEVAIDAAEAVDVDEQDRDRPVARLERADLLAQAVEELTPGRQPGQRIGFTATGRGRSRGRLGGRRVHVAPFAAARPPRPLASGPARQVPDEVGGPGQGRTGRRGLAARRGGAGPSGRQTISCRVGSPDSISNFARLWGDAPLVRASTDLYSASILSLLIFSTANPRRS